MASFAHPWWTTHKIWTEFGLNNFIPINNDVCKKFSEQSTNKLTLMAHSTEFNRKLKFVDHNASGKKEGMNISKPSFNEGRGEKEKPESSFEDTY